MEHMSEVMQHLEHACARFEVSCMVPDAYCWVYISILTVKLHRFSPLNAIACTMPAGAQLEKASRRRDAALSSFPKARQNMPVHP